METIINTAQGTKIKKQLTGLRVAVASAFNASSAKSIVGKHTRQLSTLTKGKVKYLRGSIDAETDLAKNISALKKVLGTRQRIVGTVIQSEEAVAEFRTYAVKALNDIKILATRLIAKGQTGQVGQTQTFVRDIALLSEATAAITAFYKNPTSKTYLRNLIGCAEIISKKIGTSFSTLKVTYTVLVGTACIVAGVSVGSVSSTSVAAIGAGYAVLYSTILGKNGSTLKSAKTNAVANKIQAVIRRTKQLLALQQLKTNGGQQSQMFSRLTFGGR